MTASIISFLAVMVLALSLLKTSRLLHEFEALDGKTRELQDRFKVTRHHLRKKLNRLVILQKQEAGEPVPTVTFKKLGKTARILFPTDTIYSIAEDEGFGLSGTCEGNADCGLCAVSILSGAENLDPIGEEEAAVLKKMGFPQGSRLSCQPRVTGDLVVDFLEQG